MTYFSGSMFHHSVWSVITAHKLTPAKRDLTTVISDQRSRFTAASIDDYSLALQTLWRNTVASKVGHEISERAH